MDPTATPPAQTPVVVIPVYGGTWTGRWQHTSCTSLDVEFDWCNGITIGDSSGLTLTLTQAGNVGTTVSGTLNLSGVIMQVTGTIASDGSLSMTGSRGTDQAIENWKSTSTGSGMEGTFDWMQLGTNGKPTRRISDRLLNVTRTGT